MREQKSLLTLTLGTDEPVELTNFVGAFTSLANEFDRFVQTTYPGTQTDPKMYVKEVRHGSIEADILTGVTAIAPIAMSHVEHIMVLEDFVKRWGSRFSSIVSGSFPKGELESPSELKDWADTARAIASDPIGSHKLEAAYFEDGKREIKASFVFSASEARTALQNIDDRQKALSKPDHHAHERVLLVFTRSDINDADVGKSSGERAKIEELSDRSLAIMYGSEVAEAHIKHEIRDADENVYKKGFVVDVIVKVRNGKPVAYSITNLHQVLDLPE